MHCIKNSLLPAHIYGSCGIVSIHRQSNIVGVYLFYWNQNFIDAKNTSIQIIRCCVHVQCIAHIFVYGGWTKEVELWINMWNYHIALLSVYINIPFSSTFLVQFLWILPWFNIYFMKMRFVMSPIEIGLFMCRSVRTVRYV